MDWIISPAKNERKAPRVELFASLTIFSEFSLKTECSLLRFCLLLSQFQSSALIMMSQK